MSSSGKKARGGNKKRGGGGRNDAYDSEDGSCNESVASNDTCDSARSTRSRVSEDTTQEDLMERYLEELTEKRHVHNYTMNLYHHDEHSSNGMTHRATTRLAALQGLLNLLVHFIPPELFHEKFDEMYNNLLQISRRPSEDEGRIVPRIFGIMGLMLGPHSHDYFAKVESVLEPLVKSAAQSDIVRAQALEGLGVVCFTSSTGDEENAQNIMGLCDPFFTNSTTPVLTTLALETWGCLASTLDSALLIEEAFLDTHLALFSDLTNNVDLDVRTAAGENLALLFEAMHQNHIDNYEGAGDIASKMLELSKESSKKFSKKDRKEQHSVFRDVYKTVADQEPPNVSFSLENETLRFHDWGSIMQYNAIKECLQSGMLEHLKFNNHVRQLFDLPHTAEVFSRVEKRATKSKTSGSRKQQSEFLKDERKRRQGEKNHFLDGGDY